MIQAWVIKSFVIFLNYAGYFYLKSLAGEAMFMDDHVTRILSITLIRYDSSISENPDILVTAEAPLFEQRFTFFSFLTVAMFLE